MGIEREFKFILRNLTEDMLLKSLADKGYTRHVIQQGYLGKRSRIRLMTTTHKSGDVVETPIVNKFFTYKKPIKGKHGVLEFEYNMDDDDFHAGWKVCTKKLTKVRYVIQEDDNQKWELDFFYKEDLSENFVVDTSSVFAYLVMAECEVYNDLTYPHMFPDLIRSHCVYAVKPEDKRFINSRLSDLKYVKGLLEEIERDSRIKGARAA